MAILPKGASASYYHNKKKKQKEAHSKAVKTTKHIDRINNVMRYYLYGADELKDEKNKKLYKPGQALPLDGALREIGISKEAFYGSINYNEQTKEIYEKFKRLKKEGISDVCEENIKDAVSKKLKLKDKDVVEFSFRYLEKTNPDYNPKQVIEQKVEEVIPQSIEELLNELNELI